MSERSSRPGEQRTWPPKGVDQMPLPMSIAVALLMLGILGGLLMLVIAAAGVISGSGGVFITQGGQAAGMASFPVALLTYGSAIAVFAISLHALRARHSRRRVALTFAASIVPVLLAAVLVTPALALGLAASYALVALLVFLGRDYLPGVD